MSLRTHPHPVPGTAGAPHAIHAPHHPAVRFAIALVVCVVLLLLGDLFHLHFAIVTQAGARWALGQAWWTVPIFVVSVPVMLAAAWPFASRMEPTNLRQLGANAAWFVGCYAASAVFGRLALPLTLALTFLFGLRLAGRPDFAPTLMFSLLLGALGPMVEAIAIAVTGMYEYSVRQVVGTPLWLPALYLHGGPLALSVAQWVMCETSDG